MLSVSALFTLLSQSIPFEVVIEEAFERNKYVKLVAEEQGSKVVKHTQDQWR